MNIITFFYLICLKAVLARLIILSILSKKLVLISVHSWFNFVPIRVNSWFNQNMKTNPKRTQTNPIFWRSNFDFSPKTKIMTYFMITFFCKTNPICPFKNLNTIILFLARSFCRIQGLGSAESGIVLLYSEHFGLSRIRRAREKESPKRKTNPMVCYPKPILSLIMEISTILRDLFMKNKPNGMLYIN